ncbi:MAG: hypothetical protein C0486_03110 [Erythrobacter sp.]|nr:hypothetical protein [Erythrobacter sp.]
MSQATAKRTSLLASCGSAALALGLILGPAPVAAQGIQAGGNVSDGVAFIDTPAPGQTTIDVVTPTAVIDWTPAVDNMGNALIFLPSGNTATFQSGQLQNFAVLNRILPDANNNVAVINGNVISRIIDPASGLQTTGGTVAFYSPTGLLIGGTATFDVGSLLLTTLDTSPASFADFANGGNLSLVGATGSTARILISPGAQISALAENSYFAVVAADVEMRGIARVNGSHAYVAGEVVNLSFSNGLFNIQVPVGTAAAGNVVTIDGTVGGPSSTGAAGDNHLIYAVARASQDPISMLLRGNLGFDPAQSAGIVNGEIIISANYDVFGRFVDGGSISDGINAVFNNNSELSTTQADIFLEDFAASSSLLAIGTHRTQVTARTTASSVAGNLIMVGRQNAELTASNGQNFTITGDVLVSAQDYGVSGSGLQSLDVLNAQGGVAFIDAFGGGTMTISGNAAVLADAFAGAEILQGVIGSAQGGTAQIGSTGGTLMIAGDATASARGVGPSGSGIFSSTLTGAPARGGLAQLFSVQGGNVTLGGSLLLDASASATGSLNTTTTTPSEAFGGNAFLNIFNGAGTITIGSTATLRANAIGGSANFSGIGGIGDAGQAIIDVNGLGVIDITGDVIAEAFGIGGDNLSGTGGNGLGGRAAATTIGGGQILMGGTYAADASGRGGDGLNGGKGLGGIAIAIARTGLIDITGSAQVFADGFGGNAGFGFGGNGGIGRGGNAAFQADGTLNDPATLMIGGDATVSATGMGGQGGAAFIQTGTPAGRGGDGFGGDFTVPNQADPAFTSGAFLLAGGDNGNISVGGSAVVSASAVGGRGGAGESTLNGGLGGDAIGGLAQVGLALLGQNGSVGLGSAVFGDVFASADASGGGGGLTLDIETGNGGAGTGGFAAFSVRAGDATAGIVTLEASGNGGAGQVAGTGTGGAAAVLGSLGGTLIVDDFSAFANGNGGFSAFGTGGAGLGGEAAIEGDGISVTINGDAVVEASGRGGLSGDGGAGGDGTGGLAYFATTLAGAPGSITVNGQAAAYALGSGGDSGLSFAAGSGTGGTAYVEAFNGSTITLGALQAAAIGRGGQTTGHEGGDGTGGTVRVRASGFSQIAVQRNVSASFASDSVARQAFFSVDGFGGDTRGGLGIGGAGRGGTIAITADNAGTVILPVNILADPARAADQLLMFARGVGGGSAADGGTGGTGTGGSATITADNGLVTMGATMLSVNGTGGSGLDPQAVSIQGGVGGGGSLRLVVSNGGIAELDSFEGEAGGTGGDGVGGGNGGNAFGGSAGTSVITGTLNIVSRLGQYSFATGGSGVIGGNAMGGGEGGGVVFQAQDAAINFSTNGGFDDGLVLRSDLTGGIGTQQGGVAQGGLLQLDLLNSTVTGQLGLTLAGQALGGRGALAGGNASGSAIDISIRDSDLDAGSLRASSGATGGDADLAMGTGGNAQGGNIQLFTNPSTIGLTDANLVASTAQGGNANIGGNAIGGNITAELNDTDLTVTSVLSSVTGLDLLSQATAGQGQNAGANMGDATAGTVSLQLNNSTINAGNLQLRTLASAGSSNPEIGGGAAAGGATLLQLSGTSLVEVGLLQLESSASSSIGQRQVQVGVDPMGNPIFTTVFDFSGSTVGGVSRLLLVENGTPQINATQIDVIADSFGSGFDLAGRFSIEVLSGGVNTFGLNARTAPFSSGLSNTVSQVIVRGGSLIAENAFFTAAEDLVFITSNGGIIGSDGTSGTSNLLLAEAGNNITVTGEGTNRGLIGGGSITFNAGRSVLLDGTLRSAGGNISLAGNNFFTAFQTQPEPTVITMSAGALIDAGSGSVSITVFDGGGNPQRETGAITLGNISAGTIDVRHFGTTAGSDITVLASGVLTASGTGRAIDLASLNGEVINLHGDAGLILTGGGHYGIFAATPTGSQIGSLSSFARRYNVLTEAAYDALNPGVNFAAFRITPVLTVTADDIARFYGSANPAFTASITGFLAGDSIADFTGALQFLTSADGTSPIGQYALNVALGTLVSPQGYQFTFAPGILTVTPRPITITASDLSRIYGNANPALGFTVGGLGLVNGDQLTGALATNAGLTSGVGSFAITQGSLAASANYAVTFVGGQLTVTPRPITIDANSISRVYGNANPALTFSVGGLGLVNGDQLSGALTTVAGVTTGVGTFAITQGTLTAGANYALTYNAGLLTITPRPITITAGNLSRVYGDANPALAFTIGGLGLVNGDQLSGALAAAGVTAGVGTSAITLGTLSAGGNYTIAFTPGLLTITPRPLTVAADNLSKTLGLADPLLTFSITAGDLVNGDVLTGSLVRDPGETIASFAIRQGTLSAGNNYAVTFVPGTFTINPPPVSPDINNPTSFEPPVVVDTSPPPVTGESDERFGIDFPERPDAPLISEDPLLDDPVASGSDSALYGEDEDDDDAATPPAGGR